MLKKIICYELGICNVLGVRKTLRTLLRWGIPTLKQMGISVISSEPSPGEGEGTSKLEKAFLQQSCVTSPWTQVPSYYYKDVTSFLNLNKFHEGKDLVHYCILASGTQLRNQSILAE